MTIPNEAVEAAARVMLDKMYNDKTLRVDDEDRDIMRAALEAAAPHMLEQVERELADAKRVIAMLVLEAGGKVTIGRRAITELSDDTVIETTQDVINGGWVIRARVPA